VAARSPGHARSRLPAGRIAFLALLAGAVALLAGAACGRKSRPLAPELVRPLPPTALTASATPEGVRLGWRRPTRTSGGRSLDDLDRFLVERARDEEPFAVVHTLVVEDRERLRPASHFEWTDTAASPGDRWRYRVIAVTLDGDRSPPSTEAAVDLAAGKAVRERPPAAP
jgi:hypothetical protein